MRCHILNSQYHIVLGFSGSSVQLWNNNGTRMLAHIKVTQSATKSINYPVSFLASAYCKCQDKAEIIAVGDSLGNIHAFYQEKSVYFKETLYTISEMPIITALSGDVQNGILCVGSSEGKIYLLSVPHVNEANVIGTIPGDVMKFPVTSMGVLQCGISILLAGYSNGQIKGYKLPEGKHLLTINAHSRAITAIDVNPNKAVIASVGEDSFMNLFEIGAQKEINVTLISSSKIENTLLCGVSFLPPNYSSVIAVAYDNSKIFYWKDII